MNLNCYIIAQKKKKKKQKKKKLKNSSALKNSPYAGVYGWDRGKSAIQNLQIWRLITNKNGAIMLHCKVEDRLFAQKEYILQQPTWKKKEKKRKIKKKKKEKGGLKREKRNKKKRENEGGIK